MSALVPGRTRRQCNKRWKDVLDPSIDRANERTGKWTEDEDSQLKVAVQTHGGKDWGAISALVPGRTEKQCYNRWHDVLHPSNGRANGSKGKWTEEQDSKLKDAVKTHGDKDWVAMSALVPGLTRAQCNNRWKDALDPSIDRANKRTGKWTEDEDIKLKDAVQTHGGKNWGAIATLVPGRTRKQCRDRWNALLFQANLSRFLKIPNQKIGGDNSKAIIEHLAKCWFPPKYRSAEEYLESNKR
jgi:hypothetical protein